MKKLFIITLAAIAAITGTQGMARDKHTDDGLLSAFAERTAKFGKKKIYCCPIKVEIGKITVPQPR